MLNGIDPVLIFQLYKLVPDPADKRTSIPLTSKAKVRVTYAIIPIYLSEQITGIYIDDESKNIDIDTTPDSLTSGEGSPVNQKALGSVTTVSLLAKQGSVGLTILLALTELILDKVASQEYEVTYMHNSITVFGGLIHGFTYDQGTNDDLYKIKIEIARGRAKSKSVQVGEDSTATRLSSEGAIPPANAPTVTPPPTGGGGSQIQPGVVQNGQT